MALLAQSNSSMHCRKRNIVVLIILASDMSSACIVITMAVNKGRVRGETLKLSDASMFAFHALTVLTSLIAAAWTVYEVRVADAAASLRSALSRHSKVGVRSCVTLGSDFQDAKAGNT